MTDDDIVLLSILIPVYNEADNVTVLHTRLVEEVDALCRTEIVFVDDGSNDDTLRNIRALSADHPNVHYISLSRNFGHQSALKAGLHFCSGDIVVSMDGDLQHPPSLIPTMIEQWRNGYDVVVTVRRESGKLGLFKRAASRAFYWIMNRMSDVELIPGAADFRLLDRRVAEVLRQSEERDIFLRGYLAWAGFKQFVLPYSPDKRHAGETKYTLGKMLRLAMDGLLGFSVLPLRAVMMVGFLMSAISCLYGLYAIFIHTLTEHSVPGWASIMTGVYFLGGIQLVCIGICGEYIGRTFMEAKKRPHYIVAETSFRETRERRKTSD